MWMRDEHVDNIMLEWSRNSGTNTMMLETTSVTRVVHVIETVATSLAAE